MALSGSIETTHSSGIRTRVEWTATQNATNNTSSVTATAKIYYGYTISASAAKAITLTIDGQSFNWSLVLGTFSGWKTLGSRTVTVSHDVGGGAKTFSMAASCAIEVQLTSGWVGTVSTSGSGTLDALGSAFNFTVPSTVTAGANVNYTATGGDSATRFHLHFKLGSNPEFEVVNRVAGDIGFTVPLGWLPTQTSAAMTVTMRAYKSGALLATITKTTTVNVASDVKPSVGALSLSRTGQSTLAQYVQGKNSVTLSIPSASAGTGSTLKNVIFTCGSQTVTRTASARSYTFSLPSAGTQSVSVKVVDQRGRSTTVSNSVVVRKYAPPRITSAPEVYRCTSAGVAAENGTYARLKVGYALGVNTTELPGIAYSTRTVKWGTSGSANLVASGTWTSAFGAGGFSEEGVYTLTVTVTDNLGGQAVQTVSLSSLFVTMDFKSGGRGIAFGKVATEDNLFDSALPMRASNGFTSVETIYGLSGLDITGDSMFRGKIHPVGGFQAQRLPAGANLNDYTDPGFWYESSNAGVEGMVNTPPSNYAGALEVLTASGTIQYWHEYSTGNTARTWRRRYYGSWSAWEWYAGTRTGGDANGGWEQYPGGLQICWYRGTPSVAINNAYGSLFVGSWTWTFPRAFSSIPVVSVSKLLWGSGASWGTVMSSTTTSATLRAIDSLSRASGSTSIEVTAIGYGSTT